VSIVTRGYMSAGVRRSYIAQPFGGRGGSGESARLLNGDKPYSSGRALCYDIIYWLSFAGLFVAVAAIFVGSFALHNTNKPFGGVVDDLKVTGVLDLSMLEMEIPAPWVVPGGGSVPGGARHGARMPDILYDLNPGSTSVILGNPSAKVQVRMPTKLNGYIGKDYYIYSNTSYAHVLNITSALNNGQNTLCGGVYQDVTFDENRLYQRLSSFLCYSKEPLWGLLKKQKLQVQQGPL
jgi:hypothetical protein